MASSAGLKKRVTSYNVLRQIGLQRAWTLIMRDALPVRVLAALCDSLPVPVFASGIGLEQAWALGASGLNEIRA